MLLQYSTVCDDGWCECAGERVASHVPGTQEHRYERDQTGRHGDRHDDRYGQQTGQYTTDNGRGEPYNNFGSTGWP